MAKDGTLGSLLQGVSQQPPAVRPIGKVTEQINFINDVVEGLSARPALVETATLLNETATGLKFSNATFEGETFIVGYSADTLRVWDIRGTQYTVQAEPEALAYIGTDMRPYLLNKQLFLANREVIVEKAASPNTSSVAQHTGVVSVLGGLFSRNYTVTLRWEDGTIASGSYSTPDGDGAGDANNSSSKTIAFNLYNSLIAHGSFKAGTVANLSANTFYVRSINGPITITVDDDDAQTTLRAHTSTAESTEDLAKTAPHGTLVKITGNDEGNEDDFYLRFNSSVTDVVGGGFGYEGVWEEWYNPAEITAFDLSTLPHVLEKTGATEFTLRQGDWLPRRVGDEDTNPFPDFVGNPIRDIGGFQSRLVFVAGAWCAMSRTNEPTDFFKKSALAEVATDPISMSSTEEGVDNIDWIIPFDRDLVLMSDPGEAQLLISGQSRITPDNNAMVQTTAFEMRGGAKPVETGRTILFPFKSGKFSGIKEFFTNDEVTTNGADTLTETLDSYIVGLVNRMECSTNFSMVAFATDAPEYSKTVWVYKYLWQNTDKLQSAFSKWVMPLDVEFYFFSGSELFVVMSEDGFVPGTTNYVFAALDLDLPVDDVAEYHISLDRQMRRVADANSGVSLPYENAAFVQGTGCLTPGRPVEPMSYVPTSSGATYTFDAETVPDGAEIVCGLRYNRSISPTMPFYRDPRGNVVPRSHIVVGNFLLEYVETGYIRATMESRYRKDPIVYEVDWFPIDDDPDDTLGNGLRSGILNIPWGERADWSTLTLSSDDVRPTTFIELEWVGQAFKGSRG